MGGVFINRGIQSILEQEYTNIEIIIVNDGSSDDSEDVIKAIIELNNKRDHLVFKYIDQKNRGIAAARNRGLEEAEGTYVMFVDQDDWIDKDYIQTLVSCAEKFDADMVIGGFKLVDLKGNVEDEWKLDDRYEWSKFRITAPWGRLYKKEVIDEYDMRFFETKISEDLYFNILFLSYASNVRVISYAGYNWLHNKKSESRTKWNVISESRNPLVMLTKLQEDVNPSNTMNHELLTYFFVKYIIWYLLYSVRGSAAGSVIGIYRLCIQWLNEYYPNWTKEVRWKNPGGEAAKTHIIILVCLWLHRVKILRPVLVLYSKVR